MINGKMISSPVIIATARGMGLVKKSKKFPSKILKLSLSFSSKIDPRTIPTIRLTTGQRIRNKI